MAAIGELNSFWLFTLEKQIIIKPGRVMQSVMCLTADTCLIAESGVASLILTQSHTFVEIDHEIISMAIIPPSADPKRAVVSYKRTYVHKVFFNRLVRLA